MSEQNERIDELHLRVAGMTCAHCVAAVTEEISIVEGVSEITVDLATGAVEVRGTGFHEGAIEAAVVEAGYEVAR